MSTPLSLHTEHPGQRNSAHPAIARPFLVKLWAFAIASASALAAAQTTPSQESVELAKATSESFAGLMQSSRNAERQSKDARVREFAAEVSGIAERTNDRLRELCRQKNILLTESAHDDAPLDQARGETFDRVYTLETSQVLAKARAILEAGSKSARIDGELKKFAAQTLPEVRELGARADALAQAQAGVRASSSAK